MDLLDDVLKRLALALAGDNDLVRLLPGARTVRASPSRGFGSSAQTVSSALKASARSGARANLRMERVITSP
ncbi:MAG: hypothetical protein VW547_11765, partial [Alphaproteobacteria bacterium]